MDRDLKGKERIKGSGLKVLYASLEVEYSTRDPLLLAIVSERKTKFWGLLSRGKREKIKTPNTISAMQIKHLISLSSRLLSVDKIAFETEKESEMKENHKAQALDFLPQRINLRAPSWECSYQMTWPCCWIWTARSLALGPCSLLSSGAEVRGWKRRPSGAFLGYIRRNWSHEACLSHLFFQMVSSCWYCLLGILLSYPTRFLYHQAPTKWNLCISL